MTKVCTQVSFCAMGPLAVFLSCFSCSCDFTECVFWAEPGGAGTCEGGSRVTEKKMLHHGLEDRGKQQEPREVALLG
jgi:hypothetical protein